jgi:hypothetical protein
LSTEPRKSSDTIADSGGVAVADHHESASPELNGEVLACPRCDQEMAVPSGEVDLPLHMSRARVCLGSCSPGAPPKFGEQIRAPLTIPDVAQFSVSEILSAQDCLSCGRQKLPGQPICKTCHGLLPFAHQKALPAFMRGYLFADDHRKVAGHYDKTTFMEVLKSALDTLAALRSAGDEHSAGGANE